MRVAALLLLCSLAFCAAEDQWNPSASDYAGYVRFTNASDNHEVINIRVSQLHEIDDDGHGVTITAQVAGEKRVLKTRMLPRDFSKLVNAAGK